MSKPKLEIVRPDDEHVDFWINGTEIASTSHDEHGWAGMRAVGEAVKAVAKALGADVEETGDPTPKPYRYFVSYFVALAGRYGEWRYVPASKWIDLDSAIESRADLDALREGMAGSAIPAANIQIMNFVLIDGPEW